MIVAEALTAPPLSACSFAMPAGLHVVLASPTVEISVLIAIVAGVIKPRSGRLRISERDPRRSPELRRRIASLLAHEELPALPDVATAVTQALLARDTQVTAIRALELAGIASWAKRATKNLSRSEARSVALAVALTSEQPLVCAFHEPLADIPGIDRERVHARLTSWAEEGVCVLCTTSSTRDANDLGGNLWFFDGGRILSRVSGPLARTSARASGLALLVRTPNARDLAAALASEPALASVSWDETRGPGELLVYGPDPHALALAIVRVTRSRQIPITAIMPVLPGSELLLAANSGYLRGAYDAAYRTALARGTGEIR